MKKLLLIIILLLSVNIMFTAIVLAETTSYSKVKHSAIEACNEGD